MSYTFSEQQILGLIATIAVGVLAVVIRYGIKLARRMPGVAAGWLFVMAGMAALAFGGANWNCYVTPSLHLPSEPKAAEIYVVERNKYITEARESAALPFHVSMTVTLMGIPLIALGFVTLVRAYDA